MRKSELKVGDIVERTRGFHDKIEIHGRGVVECLTNPGVDLICCGTGYLSKGHDADNLKLVISKSEVYKIY